MAGLGALRAGLKDLPGMKDAVRGLTEAEAAKLNKGTAEAFLALRRALPSSGEMASVAQAGGAKKGWYRNSTQALNEVFGEDAPRFTALLAAMSPQTSVESNLINALNTWKNWERAGRPTDRDSIIDIMGDSVEGERGRDSVLGAWVNNSVEALTQDPNSVVLSGPKVDSFMRNLTGVMNEVTNDTWMARYGGQPQTIFSGARSQTDAGKGPGYLAMNSKVRETADRLQQITGEAWDPAEVQETVWSWAYGLRNRDKGAQIMDNLQQLSDQDVAAAPDFGTLLQQPKYAGPLEEIGMDPVGTLANVEPSIAMPNDREIAQMALANDPRNLTQAARRIARGFGQRAAVPLAAGTGALALGQPEDAEAAGLSALRYGDLPESYTRPGTGPTPNQAFATARDSAKNAAANPAEMSAIMDVDEAYALGELSQDEAIAQLQSIGTRFGGNQSGRATPGSMAAAGAVGTAAASPSAWSDELAGAGLAAGSLANAMLTGTGAEGQALLGALSPFLSDEQALAHAERARAQAPAVSMDPRAQPYLQKAGAAVDAIGGALSGFGEDIERGFGQQSPLYQNVAPYRAAYDATGALYEELPERVKLGLGALGNLAF